MKKRVGYVSIVGRPNAGKSTLLNAIVGQKIAGVSAKPQTTRNKILGISSYAESQILFLDTPGMHRLGKAIKINSLMNREAFSVIQQSNLILFMVDGIVGMTPTDVDFLKKILHESQVTVAILMSKSDRCPRARRKESEQGVSAVLDQLEDPRNLLHQKSRL